MPTRARRNAVQAEESAEESAVVFEESAEDAAPVEKKTYRPRTVTPGMRLDRATKVLEKAAGKLEKVQDRIDFFTAAKDELVKSRDAAQADVDAVRESLFGGRTEDGAALALDRVSDPFSTDDAEAF